MNHTNGKTPKRFEIVKTNGLHKDFHTNGKVPQKNSLHKELREKKGLSERELAEKLGISKTTLHHDEIKSLEDLTMRKLQALADALQVKYEFLAIHAARFKKQNFIRSDIKSPFFTIHYGEGIQIASLLPKLDFMFAGCLTLPPYKTLPFEKVRTLEAVFYIVRDGILAVKTGSEEKVLKPGETLLIQYPLPHELYNPNQLKDTVVFLVTFPSFAPHPF